MKQLLFGVLILFISTLFIFKSDSEFYKIKNKIEDESNEDDLDISSPFFKYMLGLTAAGFSTMLLRSPFADYDNYLMLSGMEISVVLILLAIVISMAFIVTAAVSSVSKETKKEREMVLFKAMYLSSRVLSYILMFATIIAIYYSKIL